MSSRRIRQHPGENVTILVKCKCGYLAINRTSHTPGNPNRKFFRCRKWNPKQSENPCDFFVWQDIQVAIEKKKQKYKVLISGLKMDNTRFREENFSLSKWNNELQELLAQLLVGNLQLENKNCTEQDLCTPMKEELDMIRARLGFVESVVLGLMLQRVIHVHLQLQSFV
ncbi:unnamed protein product [Linum trigynum]|uniref:GRF-type domain-containing protein n=1 Tax=Linum trigynum TaxID=586398 RepID=A0AAV2CEB0_9ROSI